jgi:hypothetical protein
MKQLFASLFLIALLVACTGEKKADSPVVKKEQAPEMPPHGGMSDLTALTENQKIDLTNPEVKLSNFAIYTPDAWKREVPSTSMRVVQYSLKADSTLKVTGFFFGMQDMIRENIDRWKAEFSDLKKTDETKLLSDKATMVIMEGTYRLKPSPMAQEFKETPDYMVLAAIIPSKDGPYYFKIFGPKSELSKQIDIFKKFINSYKVQA